MSAADHTSGDETMKYILALDQGTTSSRAILFDKDATIRAMAQREFTQFFPRPGWVEHDPKEIWESQLRVTREVLAALEPKSEIAAVGIANQRETTIIWDRQTGEPVYNAIVWQDRRTAPLCARLLADGYAALFQERTGLLLDPYFAGTKLRWILDNVDGARARAEQGCLAFGTVDTWLVWNLTGGKRHVTDVSNASRTLLFNIHTGGWDDELLAILDIPRKLLPEVASSSEIYGSVSGDAFAGGTPISGIAGDQQAALFGQACFEPGMAKNTYGTGCFMLMMTGAAPVSSKNNLISTVAWKVKSRTEYALEGSVFIAGAVVQWLRDGLGLIKNASEIEALAASVPDTGGAYLVPAFAGLGAPHWDARARGALVGLTRGTTSGHIARAALEAIAYQSHDVLRAMERDSAVPLRELRVDGGASRNNLLMQFQADLLQVPVARPKIVETTALGAAGLAGLAIGFWESREEIASHWMIDRCFEPSRPAESMLLRIDCWNRAVKRAAEWEPIDSATPL